MSIELYHPRDEITSAGDMTISVKNKATKGTVIIDSSSVILPINSNEFGTYGIKSAIMFDDSVKRMKYHNGSEWITIAKGSDLTDPINTELTNIKNVLDTKVDTVISGVSSVPMASISGTTLYINFPVTGGGGDLPEDQTGLFTNAPEGAIQGYSLLSGQTQEQARDTLGDQSSSDGTVDNPYVTTTGWCIADGKYWTWVGESGTITRQVPNLNDQSPYLAGTPSNGRTITDRVILATGQVLGHTLTIDEMPRHKHGIKLGHEEGGKNDPTGYPNLDWSGPYAVHSENQPDYSWGTPGGGGNPLGSVGGNQPHSHGVSNLQPNHCNIIWMYNIAIPQAALTISKADGRYVLKTGDNMSGSLGIQGRVTPTDYGNFDSRYVNKSGDSMYGSLGIQGRVTPSDYGNFDERYARAGSGGSLTTYMGSQTRQPSGDYKVNKTFVATTGATSIVLHARHGLDPTNESPYQFRINVYKNNALVSTPVITFGTWEREATTFVNVACSVGDTIRIEDDTSFPSVPLGYIIITLAG